MAYRINESVCNGCDACVTACPTQAISGVQHEVHTIDPDKCVSCNLCMESVQELCDKKRNAKRDNRA